MSYIEKLETFNSEMDEGLYKISLHSASKVGIVLTDSELEKYHLSWEGFTKSINKEISRLYNYGASIKTIKNVFNANFHNRVKKAMRSIGLKIIDSRTLKESFKENEFVNTYIAEYIRFLKNIKVYSELKGGEGD